MKKTKKKHNTVNLVDKNKQTKQLFVSENIKDRALLVPVSLLRYYFGNTCLKLRILFLWNYMFESYGLCEGFYWSPQPLFFLQLLQLLYITRISNLKYTIKCIVHALQNMVVMFCIYCHLFNFALLPLQRLGFNSAMVLPSWLGTKLYTAGSVCRCEASKGTVNIGCDL